MNVYMTCEGYFRTDLRFVAPPSENMLGSQREQN